MGMRRGGEQSVMKYGRKKNRKRVVKKVKKKSLKGGSNSRPSAY